MSKNSLMKKMIDSMGKKSLAVTLETSEFFQKDVVAHTPIPINNLMLSGKLDGGMMPGIVQVVGDSRTLKTGFCVMQVKSFLDEHEDGVCIFADNEFGAGTFFDSYGVDKSRVIHMPFENIEDLTHQLVPAIEAITRNDKVIVFIDSISQSASKNEMENALEGKGTRDMTRAQAVNSLFRIITTMLNIRNIPLFVINSFYDPIGNPYAEKVIKGGKQIFLSSDTILFVTRSQEKDGTEFQGWNFNYTILKSRFIKEKEKLTITVRYDNGIDRMSGVFELGLEGGFITAPKQGWYQFEPISGIDVGKLLRRKEIDEKLLGALVNNDAFKKYVYERYSLEGMGPIMKDGIAEVSVDPETGEVIVVEQE